MRHIFTMTLLTLVSAAFTLNGQTNDFYDDAPANPLKGNKTIFITGEVESEMTIDLNTLPLRSIIVKETTLSEGKVAFTGAYRYDGYSLYDILDRIVLKKKNAEEYPPIIDLYAEVSNDAGEKVVLSWGELYYPNNRHAIIIATSVTRIVPSKTRELWPLPAYNKLIVGTDLITVRNITNPAKITIRSLDSKYKITRDLSPMYSEKFSLGVNGSTLKEIAKLPEESTIYTYNTVFYGRGRGIHGTTPFTGILLKDLLEGIYAMTADALQSGLVEVAGLDGYRGAFSLSEIVNRNDQQEILLIDRGEEEGSGRFSLFPSCDFFSDRAIKSILDINLLLP